MTAKNVGRCKSFWWWLHSPHKWKVYGVPDWSIYNARECTRCGLMQIYSTKPMDYKYVDATKEDFETRLKKIEEKRQQNVESEKEYDAYLLKIENDRINNLQRISETR